MAGTVMVAFPEDDLPDMLDNHATKPKVDLVFVARVAVCGGRRGACIPKSLGASGPTLSVEQTDLLSAESLGRLMDALAELDPRDVAAERRQIWEAL